jgi:hypothetical protein
MRGSATKDRAGHPIVKSSAKLASDLHRTSLLNVGSTNQPGVGGGIEISEFVPSGLSSGLKKIEARRDFGHWRHWTRALGVLGTLLVHGIALNTVGWGLSAHKRPSPKLQSMGTTRTESASAPADELILLTLDSSQKNDEDLPGSIADLKPSLSEVRLELLNPEPVAITADPDAGTASTTTVTDPGDPALRTLMFGRYQGQISARIERADRVPASGVRAG